MIESTTIVQYQILPRTRLVTRLLENIHENESITKMSTHHTPANELS